jgi:spermidine synthase
MTIDSQPAAAAVPLRAESHHQPQQPMVMTTRWLLLPLVAASGFAGLGYEIVWTRQLALGLGTEMMAVLGAVAGFFGGLALGAVALDRPIRSASSPWLAYALLEAVIGVWGLICVVLLPAAARWLAPLLGPEPAPFLLWSASFALPMLVLLPATMAMGGTLTALERMIGSAWRDDRVSAGIFGANTAGAVGGCLASAFLLLPALGLAGTLVALAVVNMICALAVVAIGRGQRVKPLPPARPGRLPARLVVTLFATGLLGICFEVLVIRLAAQVMQDTIFTFAGLLAAYLLGAALGGLAWQKIGRGTREGDLAVLLAGTALCCLGTGMLAPAISGIAEAAADRGFAGELAVAAALFLLPSALMGATFGVLAQQMRDLKGSLGWAVGINGFGACLAPLAAALLLIPALGASPAVVVVAIGYLLLMPLRSRSLLWAAGPAALAAFMLLRPSPSMIRLPDGGALLAMQEGPMVTASVVSDAAGVRYLEVNGRFRMGGTSSVRSDYRQAMLPLLLHPEPKQSLFLGLGTGATLIGGTKMPDLSVHGVELSKEVVSLLPWFVTPTDLAHAKITVADARRFVVSDERSYDVIIADLFHPALDGSGALYTKEHFAAVRRRLAAGGIFCQWLPLYQLDAPSLRAIIRSFLAVYPGASAWLNHFSVRTPMLALIGSRDGGGPDAANFVARLRAPATAAVTAPFGFVDGLDLAGQFVAGPRSLAAYAGDGPLNTDDYPFVTFDAERNVRALTAPPWSLLLTAIRDIRSDPTELHGASESFGLERLKAFYAARNRFLEAGASLPGDPRGRALIDAAAPGLIEALRLSPDFEPAYQPLMAMARALLDSDPAAGRALLGSIISAAPSRQEARRLLELSQQR